MGAEKKYLSLSKLEEYDELIKEKIDSDIASLKSYTDTSLSSKVPTTRKINGKALSADITLTASDVGAATSGHTHNYAGSSSAGGSATSAVKLDTATAGSATQPVYFSGGKPVACTYALNKTVPSDAKFTDTVYTHPVYTARTGVPTANATLSFGGTFNVTQPVSDGTGHITAMNTRTYTMPSDRLFTTLVPTGTAIPANANLNTATYLKVGRYYCAQTNTAKTLTNCPVSEAFMMEVYSPLSTTIDNETTNAWVYRLRKITHYSTGIQYIQFCSVGSTANVWTYANWYVVPRAPFTLDSTDSNGGSATVGSTTQPVYINNGTFAACSYTLGKSVPSNAVFTDTNTMVTNTLATTTKAYVTGTTSATTNTGTQVFDTGVYLDTTAGKLTATSFSGSGASLTSLNASNISSGTLAVARGGTGVTSNPSMLINLGSTSAASVFATSPRPGVTGTLPVSKGGTGRTDAVPVVYSADGMPSNPVAGVIYAVPI